MSGERELFKVTETGSGWFSLYIKGKKMAESKSTEVLNILVNELVRKEKLKIINT